MPYAPEYRRERMREYYRRNRNRLDEQSRIWGDQQRLKVLSILGGRCVRCGVEDSDILAVDHVQGGGSKERRIHRSQRTVFAKILRDESAAERYQVLCHNCNWKKHLEDLRAKRVCEAT